jgi:DNA adenine methylase
MAVFEPLAERLRDTMIMAGDWARVVTPAVLQSGGNGVTGVFLDPPYADTAGRTADLYAKDSESVAHAVREWAIANGDDPRLRIALCGYDGEHVMPASWSELAWKAAGGYEGQAKGGRTGNSKRERIWFSPHCLRPGLWEATA